MRCAAGTGFVSSKDFPEDTNDLVDKACKTALVADVAADHGFTYITLAVIIIIGMTCGRDYILFNNNFTAD